MRGHNQDSEGRRPVFSRGADGRLHAGSNRVTPPARPEPEEPAQRKEPPVLSLPPALHTSPLKPSDTSGYTQSRLRSQLRPEQPQTSPTAPMPPAPLHPAADISHDIGDLWSEQERIRLQEDWEEEERKRERRKRRKELFRKKLTGINGATPPAAASPVRPQAGAASSTGMTRPSGTPVQPKEITVNISLPNMPKVALPKVRMPAVSLPRVSKGRMVAAGVLLAAVVGGFTVYGFVQNRDNDTVKTAADSASVNGVSIKELQASKQTSKPDYKTVLPNGNSIEAYGAWVRVSPPDKNAVYAYADKLNGVLINVSEQPLPSTFRADTYSSLLELAKQYSANTTLQAGATTAYIGTSAKGPQSVLFVKEDLLIMIKSASRIPNEKWQEYIQSLR